MRNDWVIMIAQTFGTDFQAIVRRVATNLEEYTEAWAGNPDKVTAACEGLEKSLGEVLTAIYRTKSELKV